MKSEKVVHNAMGARKDELQRKKLDPGPGLGPVCC
jgi:hypothetical protein